MDYGTAWNCFTGVLVEDGEERNGLNLMKKTKTKQRNEIRVLMKLAVDVNALVHLCRIGC